jgi:hypothetical protein
MMGIGVEALGQVDKRAATGLVHRSLIHRPTQARALSKSTRLGEADLLEAVKVATIGLSRTSLRHPPVSSGLYNRLLRGPGIAPMVVPSRTPVSGNVYRGFESPPLRLGKPRTAIQSPVREAGVVLTGVLGQ